MKILHKNTTFETNTIGTANLLDAVRFLDKPCIVVIVTTDKVYENKEELVRNGNTTGMIISGFTLGFLILAGALSGAVK